MALRSRYSRQAGQRTRGCGQGADRSHWQPSHSGFWFLCCQSGPDTSAARACLPRTSWPATAPWLLGRGGGGGARLPQDILSQRTAHRTIPVKLHAPACCTRGSADDKLIVLADWMHAMAAPPGRRRAAVRSTRSELRGRAARARAHAGRCGWQNGALVANCTQTLSSVKSALSTSQAGGLYARKLQTPLRRAAPWSCTGGIAVAVSTRRCAGATLKHMLPMRAERLTSTGPSTYCCSPWKKPRRGPSGAAPIPLALLACTHTFACSSSQEGRTSRTAICDCKHTALSIPQ